MDTGTIPFHALPGVDFPSGQRIVLGAILHVDPTQAAALVGATPDDYLDRIEAWSRVEEFVYGVRVERDPPRITQAGR